MQSDRQTIGVGLQGNSFTHSTSGGCVIIIGFSSLIRSLTSALGHRFLIAKAFNLCGRWVCTVDHSVIACHPINGLPPKKQQRRLTLKKSTKVVEGKMHFCLISHWKQLLVGWPGQKNFEKTSPKSVSYLPPLLLPFGGLTVYRVWSCKPRMDGNVMWPQIWYITSVNAEGITHIHYHTVHDNARLSFPCWTWKGRQTNNASPFDGYHMSRWSVFSWLKEIT
jgi:hypothetical protein